jgi:hypothetical protein
MLKEVRVVLHAYISDQSRKSKSARSFYETMKQKVNSNEWLPPFQWESLEATDGIKVPVGDRSRVLNLRFHDELYSPYFRTDMNLFHMLMMDHSAEVVVYKADKGWLFTFEGVPLGPQPFGQSGFDTR